MAIEKQSFSRFEKTGYYPKSSSTNTWTRSAKNVREPQRRCPNSFFAGNAAIRPLASLVQVDDSFGRGEKHHDRPYESAYIVVALKHAHNSNYSKN